MIRVLGDVHGKFRRYKEKLEGAEQSLQLGDMGIGFGEELAPLPPQHKFIRGNHDNPQQCKTHPNYKGEYGYDEDKQLFYLGGAWSIDKAIRLSWEAQGNPKSWWEDEELSQEQLQAAFRLFIETRPRIMITHDCPSFMAERILARVSGLPFGDSSYNSTRTAVWLQRMWRIHEPEVWVFGHWHIDLDQQVSNTRFVCLSELSHIDLEAE
jgi:predicted phosphodiesterase